MAFQVADATDFENIEKVMESVMSNYPGDINTKKFGPNKDMYLMSWLGTCKVKRMIHYYLFKVDDIPYDEILAGTTMAKSGNINEGLVLTD